MKPSRLWIYRLLTAVMPESRLYGFKRQLARWCGIRIGKNVRIHSSAVFYGTGALELGDNVWIGPGCFIASIAPAKVTIGANCDFGPYVTVLTGTHEIDPMGEHIAGEGKAFSVEIGNGCWLGARSLILPGVNLAKKTLVAAGSVVVESCEKNCTLIAGVPAIQKKVLA